MNPIHSQPQNPKVKLISFGSGIVGVNRALLRLERQVKQFPLIDECEIFGSDDLGENFKQLFGDLVKSHPKGYGLWAWKPYFILQELKKLSKGDVLVYVDAGVEINPKGLARFSDYLDYVSRQSILLFSQSLQNRFWTKSDGRLVTFDEHYFRNQLVGSVSIYRADEKSLKFVEEWLMRCQEEGGTLLMDPVSSDLQSKGFMSHRHDQSVLSRVAYEQSVPTIPDETYFDPWARGKSMPLLALRNKQTGLSWLFTAFHLPKSIFRIWQYLTLFFTPGVLKSKTVKSAKWNP